MSTTNRKTLEPFKEVLKRQKPEVIGEPYNMKVFQNSLPKSAGDPWRGAYSKHGFWYKFHDGKKEEFDELAVLSIEQDNYMLCYDYYSAWINVYGEENVKVLTAKNLKNEVMGGVVAIRKKNYTQIGVYFVKEEFRHSGIGSKLFKEASKGSVDIVFNATTDTASAQEWDSICDFDQKICGEERQLSKLLQLEGSKTVAVFDSEDHCVGYGTSRELAGKPVKRILVGPLYSTNSTVAETIVRALLQQYYNPDEDFDFDPDCYAIYRRSVEFVLPTHERLMFIIRKLNGNGGKLTKERMWYKVRTKVSRT
ncbi:unnamed protein product [Heligmosomoides polygyrus]|uniref:Acetyltransf_18 domain-containing protein n=1 Tax=Heligmosomoides polygyrus TaxID=6339 RepID=A0A183GMT5_HELPZ|nr:unnamed protein product [Heligmosomoides polygyrus]